ncbi:hypothetical protein BpHYR1_030367 [Brachionus plicatilis]|uniref:Uncharacterized protein n=1 Tax=Brachionus plicatilis TaxID=10195 RepID=A0A3M7PCR2_BRAPC|nr:hypothetical protein BpHYR1_030367 [Brachionus plicatilis]
MKENQKEYQRTIGSISMAETTSVMTLEATVRLQEEKWIITAKHKCRVLFLTSGHFLEFSKTNESQI